MPSGTNKQARKTYTFNCHTIHIPYTRQHAKSQSLHFDGWTCEGTVGASARARARKKTNIRTIGFDLSQRQAKVVPSTRRCSREPNKNEHPPSIKIIIKRTREIFSHNLLIITYFSIANPFCRCHQPATSTYYRHLNVVLHGEDVAILCSTLCEPIYIAGFLIYPHKLNKLFHWFSRMRHEQHIFAVLLSEN